MSAKPKVIAGVWGTVGGIAGLVIYRRCRDFEIETPGVRDAVQKLSASGSARSFLGAGDLRIARWPLRWSKVDTIDGRATARFAVQAESGTSMQVLMTAKRRTPNSDLPFEGGFEELESQAGGWRSFLSRPWEAKLWVSSQFKRLRQGSDATVNAVDLGEWELDTLVMLPPRSTSSADVLLGDVRGVPDYEAMLVRRDSDVKDGASRFRLRVVMGIALGGAVLAGGLRSVKAFGVSKSYGYIQNALLKHSATQEALGANATIQTSSGTFKPNYVDAKMRLLGSSGAFADVVIAATRDGGGRQPWRVVLAKMNVGGRTYNLDRSQF